jgi:peptidoglycan/LPS O-acetylase OafA/YrhL
MERNGIQAFRAIACGLVLFQHVTYYACEARGIPYEPFLPINFGQMGVAMFFVISGFVMGKCLGEGRAFILHRAARIYPPFWLAIAISALVLGYGTHDWHFDLWSAALLPSADLNNSYMIPYWTLCYEAAFYVATYALIVLRVPRASIPYVCISWIAAIVLFDAYRTGGIMPSLTGPAFVAQPGWLILLSPVTILFPFGLFLSTATAVARSTPTAVLVLAALTAWILSNHLTSSLACSYILQGIAYSATLLVAQRTPFPQIAARLGDYSYGLYLIHAVAIAAVSRSLPHGADSPRLLAIWTLMLLSSLAAGTMYGWFEYWIHTRFVRPIFRAHTGVLKAEQGALPRSA